ncbi:MAG TPA: DUF4258 domain-containing protein [Candidatus Nanoarchaeia archaeon]|nr:DUF4258 domain-containing protein [Candidatus Nanoarchaeia archaeon]
MLLRFTSHAMDKMDALGIEIKEVERAIKEGMKWKDSNGKWHAQMAGIEVVFVKQEGEFVIITTYLAGGSK